MVRHGSVFLFTRALFSHLLPLVLTDVVCVGHVLSPPLVLLLLLTVIFQSPTHVVLFSNLSPVDCYMCGLSRCSRARLDARALTEVATMGRYSEAQVGRCRCHPRRRSRRRTGTAGDIRTKSAVRPDVRPAVLHLSGCPLFIRPLTKVCAVRAPLAVLVLARGSSRGGGLLLRSILSAAF